jgi:hypothetical protein
MRPSSRQGLHLSPVGQGRLTIQRHIRLIPSRLLDWERTLLLDRIPAWQRTLFLQLCLSDGQNRHHTLVTLGRTLKVIRERRLLCLDLEE